LKTFEQTVRDDFLEPLRQILNTLADEEAHSEFAFFSGVFTMVQDPASQEEVLMAIVELSNCAFLGFQYSETAQTQINALLDYWIEISHAMSASDQAH